MVCYAKSGKNVYNTATAKTKCMAPVFRQKSMQNTRCTAPVPPGYRRVKQNMYKIKEPPEKGGSFGVYYTAKNNFCKRGGC